MRGFGKKASLVLFITLMLFTSNIAAELGFYGLAGSDADKNVHFGLDIIYKDKIGLGFIYVLKLDSIETAMSEQMALYLGSDLTSQKRRIERTGCITLIYKFFDVFGIYAGINIDNVRIYKEYEYPEENFFWVESDKHIEIPAAIGIIVETDGFLLQSGTNTNDGFESFYFMIGIKLKNIK